jgi:dipeptidyl aminopeptidase/acylaminoacyl peptidase
MSVRRLIALGVLIVGVGLVVVVAARPQQRPQQRPAEATPDAWQQRLAGLERSLSFLEQSLARRADEQMLFHRLEDVAVVDKVRYTGPPPRVVKNPNAPGAKNPVIIPAYTFLPKKDHSGKLPLLVYVHGGVHGNLNANHVNVLRELVQQGYAVIAPEYRGSSGYGRQFWELIDYGGLEVEDVHAGRQWMLESHANLDPQRVGIRAGATGG